MKPSPQSGFTLVETLVGMFLLAVVMIGLALMITVSMQTGQRTRVDTEATMLAQWELEQMLAQPLSVTTFTDANGNTSSLAPGGSPLVNGAIDFSQAPVTSYCAILTSTTGGQYELRWNVQTLSDGSKQFIVAARKNSRQRFLMPPINLATRLGR